MNLGIINKIVIKHSILEKNQSIYGLTVYENDET